MIIPVLDRKMLRDLFRLRIQVLAIALVMACGVMTLILALGATRSLEETRATFYDRYRFASVFATATRAPERLRSRIAAIDGLAAVETRITGTVILDVEGMKEPGSAIAVSLPDHRDTLVNKLYLRSGRLPEPGRADEAAIVETFAAAHGFQPGDSFAAVINGQKRLLKISGIVLSPEFIYAMGPGDMVPDQRRFGIIFMSHTAMAAAFDMKGAFNDVAMTTLKGADERAVIEAVDTILKPFGGRGAHGRNEQTSHAFLDAELVQLRGMAVIIPPIFLFISAFLVNMILSRLIALEREQIGLLKAIGYTDFGVGWHYGKLVIAISLIGLLIGGAAGSFLGHGLTRLYGDFFSFPFLIFVDSADLYIISGLTAVAAALAGAAKAIWETVILPPAVAMRPPAPTRYRSLTTSRPGGVQLVSQLTRMALRHLVRWPVRSGLTALGTAMSLGLLVTALFSFDSVDAMIETIFFQTERQDATLTFAGEKPPNVMASVAGLPGVLRAEPFRTTGVLIRNGHIERRMAISGLAPGSVLARILDVEGHPVDPPPAGLLLSERVASLLDVRAGETLEIELLQRDSKTVSLPVTAVVQSLVGLTAYMQLDALDRLLGTGPRLSGARVLLDENRLTDAYGIIKKTPAIASVALQGISRDRFRETIRENIVISVTVYVGLAIIITFGVIYNSARIQLSERARELASLRVFGFTRGEVSGVLMLELAIIVIAAQPLGWLLGYGFSKLVITGFESDLFRLPLVINMSTFAISSLVVLSAALFSALLVRRRIDRLDLIRVLKTRE